MEEDLLFFWPREFQSAEREGAADMLCFRGDWPAECMCRSIAGEVMLGFSYSRGEGPH